MQITISKLAALATIIFCFCLRAPAVPITRPIPQTSQASSPLPRRPVTRRSSNGKNLHKTCHKSPGFFRKKGGAWLGGKYLPTFLVSSAGFSPRPASQHVQPTQPFSSTGDAGREVRRELSRVPNDPQFHCNPSKHLSILSLNDPICATTCCSPPKSCQVEKKCINRINMIRFVVKYAGESKCRAFWRLGLAYAL